MRTLSRLNPLVFLLSAALACSLLGARPAHAGLTFFNDNQPGFLTAMTTAGNTSLGTENFEESNLAAGAFTNLNDPLTQGTPNTNGGQGFPAGLLQPLTVQSNTLAGSATTTSPRGTTGLFAGAGNRAGATPGNHFVDANSQPDSLDLIFGAPTNLNGVGFNPFRETLAGTVQVQVYNLSNTLLGTTTITADPTLTHYLGVQTTGTDRIGRINIFSTANGFEGADNIQLFAAPVGVPEPSTYAMLLVGLGFLAFTMRKKKPATV